MARNPLDRFSLNIGRLCNEWADLEEAVRHTFILVSGMPNGPVTHMTRCIDIRDMLTAIKVGAVATDTPEIATWTAETVAMADYIDNVLRPRRNRYIHDALWPGQFGVMRQTTQPKLVKSQSRQPLEIAIDTRVEEIADLRATVKSVRECWIWLGNREWARTHMRENPELYEGPCELYLPPRLPALPTGTPVQDHKSYQEFVALLQGALLV